MKKFKYFTFILLSTLCIFAAFAFGGCKEAGNYYVENSFEYNINKSY